MGGGGCGWRLTSASIACHESHPPIVAAATAPIDRQEYSPGHEPTEQIHGRGTGVARQESHEARGVFIEAVVSDLDGLAAAKGLHFGGELRPRRHLRATDEHGDDGHPASQGRGDLVTNEILPLRLPRLHDLQPPPAHHGEHVIAPGECLLDGLLEILAGLYILHIHEDAVRTEARDQPVGQAAGMSARVISSVVNEEIHHDCAT